MIKKTIIGIIILVLVGITVKSCMAVLPKKPMKPSEYDLGMTYEKAAKEDKPILTVFYADWCSYCIRFMPKLDTVRKAYTKDFNVLLVNVEDPKNAKLVAEYQIGGFPTVYIIDPKYDNRVHIDTPYLASVETLSKEVDRYNNMRKLVKKGESCSK